MIVEPKVKGFICTTAHPKGCAESVRRQIEVAKKKGRVEWPNKTSDGPVKALVIGSSTGYGLASRIAVAYGYGASTIGVAFEKELEIEETRLERGSLHLIVVVVKSAYIIAVIGNHVSQSAAGHKSNFALILTCLGVAEHPVVGVHYQHDVVLLLGYIRSDKYFLRS